MNSLYVQLLLHQTKEGFYQGKIVQGLFYKWKANKVFKTNTYKEIKRFAPMLFPVFVLPILSFSTTVPPKMNAPMVFPYLTTLLSETKTEKFVRGLCGLLCLSPWKFCVSDCAHERSCVFRELRYPVAIFWMRTWTRGPFVH